MNAAVSYVPRYIEAHRSGLLQERSDLLQKALKRCSLCPRKCGVDRLADKRGVCKTGAKALVSSYGPHFGEESVFVGTGGSGTIFFTHCNLLCLFCQNYEVSHEGVGNEVTAEWLADTMLDLQQRGCHNINLISPSHVVPQIVEALLLAVPKGLCLPLVFNSSGYDSVGTLRLLDGIVDIYMPDFKFWDHSVSKLACNAPEYPEVVKLALKEMQRQVGDLVLDERGLAVKGLLVRHLVLPENLADSREVMRFLAQEVSPNVYVNVMGQYRPCGRATEHEQFAKWVTVAELEEALAAAKDEGINRLEQQAQAVPPPLRG